MQEAVAAGNDEIVQLKATAAALRDELESIKFTYEERLQESDRAARDEAGHLQQTIVSMRSELESGAVGGS